MKIDYKRMKTQKFSVGDIVIAHDKYTEAIYKYLMVEGKNGWCLLDVERNKMVINDYCYELLELFIEEDMELEIIDVIPADKIRIEYDK